MKRRQLVLELGGMSAPILRAAAFLLRDSRISCTVRTISSPRELPCADVLRLELGSMMRPLLTVLWGGDQARSASSQTSLGLSQAVWFEDNPNERWRRASAP